MTTHREKSDFNKQVVSDSIPNLLDDAIEWIAYNLQPEEVFGDDKLREWAKENDLVDASTVEVQP